jgi:hypothetical protein
MKLITTLVLIFLVSTQVIYQIPSRIERANSHEVTDFNVSSLDAFPKDAIVICLYERYATLLYFQKIYDQRPDVTIMLRDQDAYLQTLDQYLPTYPVLIDEKNKIVDEKYGLTRYFRRWYLIGEN